MARVTILILDSLGVGATQDAFRFNHQGADTFGHIADWCENNPRGSLKIPHLLRLGLGKANALSTPLTPPSQFIHVSVNAWYGVCEERSTGVDTPSGHWEMAGLPVDFEWGYFKNKTNSFPQTFLNHFKEKAKLKGILGNCHASGMDILKQMASKHMLSQYPICYTSADSVFQIAAHESIIPLKKLYSLCEIARELLNEYKIGRVIARPFLGKEGSFYRTSNRKDYTTPPHASTLLDQLVLAQREVHAIGKIADIFAHRGITHTIKASGHDALFDATLKSMEHAKPGSLVLTNFVEFDQSFGHRRDVSGYAKALEAFDQRLPEIINKMNNDDLLILTADHGCDPTWSGNDHTRECVPFLMYRPNSQSEKNIGIRSSFSDIGQTVAEYLKIAPLSYGTSVL
jgi:phosphopentomutase